MRAADYIRLTHLKLSSFSIAAARFRLFLPQLCKRLMSIRLFDNVTGILLVRVRIKLDESLQLDFLNIRFNYNN